MPKDKLTDYSATNASNTDVGGVNIDEGMLPSGVNNAIREVLTHLKNFASGTDGIDVLSLADDDASAAMKIQAPASVTADTTLTLPDGDGSDGQVLMTDGSGTLSWVNLSNPNIIINGDMAISQRGTSSTGLGASAGYYTVDRFQLGVGGTATAGRLTMSQDSDAPEGFGSSLKLACTTADTSIAADENLRLVTVLEGQNLQAFKKGTANAESMTLSFYVKANASATYVVELYDTDNARHICNTFSVTTSWQRVEITFDGDTTGEFGNDNGGSLRLHFWLHAGSNYNSGTLATSWAANTNANRAVGADSFYDSTSNTFFITGVKLEVGSTATPFQHESYADNLRKCQRYYYRIQEGNTYQRFGTGQNSSTVSCRLTPSFAVEMRSTPSLDHTGTASNYAVYYNSTVNACTAVPYVSTSQSNSSIAEVLFTATGLTSGGASSALANNNTTVYLAYNAEL